MSGTWRLPQAAALAFALLLASACATKSSSTPRAPLAPVRQNVDVDPEVDAPDPAMTALLAPYAKDVAVLRAPIGRASADFLRRDPYLGAWIADVVCDAAEESIQMPVQGAFVNKGGIRSDLAGGDVSKYDIMSVMPFDNKIVVLELDSEQMRDLAAYLAKEKGSFPVSGMSLRVGEKGELVDFMIDGGPIKPGVTYRIATSDYLASGGDGMSIMKQFSPPLETGLLIREMMLDQVKHLTAQGRTLDHPGNADRYLILEASQDTSNITHTGETPK